MSVTRDLRANIREVSLEVHAANARSASSSMKDWLSPK